MKKHTTIIFSLILALLLSACSSVPSPENDKLPVSTQSTIPSDSSTLASATTTDIPSSYVTLDELVIFDQDSVRITVKGLSNDNFMGPSIKVLVENGSTQNITVQKREENCNFSCI